jgi:RNAse (barnase) inhibitor barstar
MSTSLLTDHSLAGVFCMDANRIPLLQEEGIKHDLRWVALKLTGSTPQETLQKIGHGLLFPDWYGANLDALSDCLCDPEIFPADRGYVLLIQDLPSWCRQQPEALSDLISVLDNACATRNGPGHPAWVLIAHPITGLNTLPPA